MAVGARDGRSEEWDDSSDPLVRPYAVTMGRISSETPLDLLTLVYTTITGREALTRQAIPVPESRAIAQLCRQLNSVAEISARLELPVVVVQVLVDDLYQAGLVSITCPQAGERPDPKLLERVLYGLAGL